LLFKKRSIYFHFFQCYSDTTDETPKQEQEMVQEQAQESTPEVNYLLNNNNLCSSNNILREILNIFVMFHTRRKKTKRKRNKKLKRKQTKTTQKQHLNRFHHMVLGQQYQQ
jgi:hypothetical protein